MDMKTRWQLKAHGSRCGQLWILLCGSQSSTSRIASFTSSDSTFPPTKHSLHSSFYPLNTSASILPSTYNIDQHLSTISSLHSPPISAWKPDRKGRLPKGESLDQISHRATQHLAIATHLPDHLSSFDGGNVVILTLRVHGPRGSDFARHSQD